MNGNNRWTTHSTAKIKIQRFSIHFIYIQLNRQSCSSRILFWMNHRRRWVYVNGSRQKQSSELSINLLQIHSLHSLSSMSMSNSIHIYILPPFFSSLLSTPLFIPEIHFSSFYFALISLSAVIQCFSEIFSFHRKIHTIVSRMSWRKMIECCTKTKSYENFRFSFIVFIVN